MYKYESNLLNKNTIEPLVVHLDPYFRMKNFISPEGCPWSKDGGLVTQTALLIGGADFPKEVKKL